MLRFRKRNSRKTVRKKKYIPPSFIKAKTIKSFLFQGLAKNKKVVFAVGETDIRFNRPFDRKLVLIIYCISLNDAKELIQLIDQNNLQIYLPTDWINDENSAGLVYILRNIHIDTLIDNSHDNWRTNHYDKFQKMSNNIEI